MKIPHPALIITGIFVLSVVLNVTVLYLDVSRGLDALDETINPDVSQEVMSAAAQNAPATTMQSGGLTTISIPLSENRGVKYDNVALCTPPEYARERFFDSVEAENGSVGTSCVNGRCTVEIGYDDVKEIPGHIVMYVRGAGGRCERQRFGTAGHVQVTGYSATIEFTDELKRALGITGTDYDVGSTENKGYSAWQLMGTKKVTFSYAQRVASDLLKIDDRVKARIKFK